MALTRRRIELPPKSSQLPEEVDSPETLERLQRLQAIASRPISLLTAEQCHDLEQIRKLAQKVYDTPAYKTLHEHVLRLFSPAQSSVGPHTVAAFFIGCVVPSNLTEATVDVNAGCSLLCSDSLPPPDKAWGFCSQNVLWCLLSSSVTARNLREASQTSGSPVNINHDGPTLPESFDFVFMTHIPSSSKAILFVDYQNYADFPGFTRHEKARLLHQMRITDIKLLSYEMEQGSTYKDLIGNPIKVQNIKSRSDPVRDNETPVQREARRAKVSKAVATAFSRGDAEVTMNWSQAATLAFALFIVVLLAICAGFTIRALRIRNPKRRV